MLSGKSLSQHLKVQHIKMSPKIKLDRNISTGKAIRINIKQNITLGNEQISFRVKYKRMSTTYTKKPVLYPKRYRGMPDKYYFERNTTSGKKLVLFFNRPLDWTMEFDQCEFNKCEYTYDKKDYFISDAILFHAPYVLRKLEDLPPKPRGQIWIYMSQEPPSQVPSLFTDWANVFNWTWTNRRDSDIYDPYGQIGVIENKSTNKLNLSNIFSMKSKAAVWFVSHCITQSKREDYVKLLQKYIDIDIFGKCSPKQGKRDKRNRNTVAKFYKFYVSFENSLCKDYITEKILHILPTSVVPIVRGEPTPELFLPPGSYIDVRKFKSASKLGKYLKGLQFNETEYNSYFNWKTYYRAFQIAKRGSCSFCKLLHTAEYHEGLYSNIDAWVNNPGGKPLCNKNPQDLNK